VRTAVAAQVEPRSHALSRAEVALSLAVAASALVAARLYPLWSRGLELLCPLLALTGIPCPTCGGTRALTALAAGDPMGALAWNPAVALGGIAAAAWIPIGLLVLVGVVAAPRIPTHLPTATRWAVALLIGANWVYLLLNFRGWA